MRLGLGIHDPLRHTQIALTKQVQGCRYRLSIGQGHCILEIADRLLVLQEGHVRLAEIERSLEGRLSLVNVFKVRLGLFRLLRREIRSAEQESAPKHIGLDAQTGFECAFGVFVFLAVVVNNSKILIDVWNQRWKLLENDLVFPSRLIVLLSRFSAARDLKMSLDEFSVFGTQIRLRG